MSVEFDFYNMVCCFRELRSHLVNEGEKELSKGEFKVQVESGRVCVDVSEDIENL